MELLIIAVICLVVIAVAVRRKPKDDAEIKALLRAQMTPEQRAQYERDQAAKIEAERIAYNKNIRENRIVAAVIVGLLTLVVGIAIIFR